MKAAAKFRPSSSPECQRASRQKFFASNPHAYSVYMENYRARFGSARKNGLVTHAQWRDRLTEFGNHCAYCLRSFAKLTQEHMQPISRGGAHHIDNVIPACQSCNSRKGTRGVLAMAG